MKKNRVVALASLALAGSLLAGCGLKEGNGSQGQEGTFALEAVSSLRHVASLNQSLALRALRMKKAALSEGEEASVKEILPSLDLFLENGFKMESRKEEGSFEVEGGTYSVKETISFNDINNEKSAYTLFYSKESESTERDEDETKTKVVYKGVASIDVDSYLPFESVQVTETEEDEKETEVSFAIYQDERNYFVVEESHEEENGKIETEFEYRSVVNGLLVSEYSIEIEKEGTKDKVEYEVGGIEYELKRVQGSDGGYLYIVTIENEETDNEAYAKFKKAIAEDGSVSFVRILE